MRARSLTVLLLVVGCGSETDPPDSSMRDAAADTSAGDTSAGDTSAGETGTADSARPDTNVTDSGAADTSGGDTAIAGDADTGPVSMPCMASGACDPFDPTSCPTGQKCRVTAMGTACEALSMDPPLGEGAVCAQDLECGAGLWCIQFGGETEFTCQRTCPAGSIGACGTDNACIGSVGDEECVRICRPIPPRCDIYDQDCADSADMCTLVTHSETFERYTGCRPNGTVAVGDPCGGSLGRCVRGSICIRTSGVTACEEVCDADDGEPGCSISGEMCIGLASSWMVTYCR